MFLTDRHYIKDERVRRCGTAATRNDSFDRLFRSTEKALVMAYVDQLVDDGDAEWNLRSDGTLELKLFSGEIYLLGGASITRIN